MGMNNTGKPDFSRPGAIRLYDSYWKKLRAVMQAQGRKWLERAIDREYRKLEKQEKK